MKQFTTRILLSILTFLTIYGMFCFIKFEANPKVWGQEIRVAYVLVTTFLVFWINIFANIED